MTNPDPQSDSDLARSIQRGHETRDASLHVAWIAKAGMALLLAGSLTAMLALANWLTPSDEGGGTEAQPVTVERGDVRMQRQRIEQQQRQRDVLSEYGWVDRPAGVARIPIERAMELIAADPALLQGSSEESGAAATESPSDPQDSDPAAAEGRSEEPPPDEPPPEEPPPAAETTEGADDNE